MKQNILDIDPDEIVLHEIRQHPFGMVIIWGIAVSVNFAIMIGAIMASTNLDVDGLSLILAIVVVATSLILLGVSLVLTWLYTRNELVITNENIIQINQKSIFTRDVSQLNLAKIQDVSASQKGLFSTILNFGIITIETAGERESYKFIYCPDASICAKEIIEAHQQYMINHPANPGNPVNLI